jgi:O-antigen/teichoic acid export membrane protein
MTTLLKQKFSLFLDDELLKHSGIMFIASVIGGACNYIYQLYMGRALGPVEYGVFGSLFAISYILTVLTATIQTAGARFVSKFMGEKASNKISYFLEGLLKRMVLLGILLFLVITFSSGFISSFLKIESVIPVIILGSMFLFSTLLPVNLGALQGLQKFKSLAYNTVLNFFSKLVFGIVLVVIGFGVNGALGAVVAGSAITLVVSFIPLKSYLSKKSRKNRTFHFSQLYWYSLPTMIAMFCFTVPANIDVVIAKHVFDVHVAGLYTAATVLGKIILFIPGAIAVVMFPKISKLFTEKKDTIPLLSRSLLYTGCLSGVMAAGYWFFPSSVVRIPYGTAYIEVAPVVQLYGLAMFFFSLTVVLMRYSLAIHDMNYVYLLGFFTFLEIVLLAIFHSTMIEMTWILLLVNLVLLISSVIYVSRRVISLKKTPGEISDER